MNYEGSFLLYLLRRTRLVGNTQSLVTLTLFILFYFLFLIFFLQFEFFMYLFVCLFLNCCPDEIMLRRCYVASGFYRLVLKQVYGVDFSKTVASSASIEAMLEVDSELAEEN